MATVTEGFPCFFLSCKANARVKPAKTGHGRILPYFCVVLCIVCMYMCTVLLPPGGYSVEVKYIIYHMGVGADEWCSCYEWQSARSGK
jgi:hypothetical protein